MLKVKKKRFNKQIIKIKMMNCIKVLYISDQKNKKTIDQYAQLTTKIREEYAKSQECNQLKIQLTKYIQYVDNLPQ